MSSIEQNQQNEQCKINLCTKLIKCRKLCSMHYARLCRHGSPTIKLRPESRPALIKADIAHIPLSTNAKRGYAIVDKEFAYLADDYRWCLNSNGYAMTRLNNGNIYYMHWLVAGKPSKGLVTDHINRNRLDNRSNNLRHITQALNVLNSSTPKSNKSGYRYISWNTTSKYWVFAIKRNGKRLCYKYFNSLPEAIAARDNFIKELGEVIY